jgi:hypothetical protein
MYPVAVVLQYTIQYNTIQCNTQKTIKRKITFPISTVFTELLPTLLKVQIAICRFFGGGGGRRRRRRRRRRV